jgi:hypothetical protein
MTMRRREFITLLGGAAQLRGRSRRGRSRLRYRLSDFLTPILLRAMGGRCRPFSKGWARAVMLMAAGIRV